jgi:hypothetical protein
MSETATELDLVSVIPEVSTVLGLISFLGLLVFPV